MPVPPLGPPPRLFGLKITSNRIESMLVFFVFLFVSVIFYINNLISTAQTLISIGILWTLYLWIIKKPERPY
jgi:hypothetical protein